VVGRVATAGRSTCLRCVSRIAAAAALAIAIVSLLSGLGAVAALRIGIHLLGLVVGLVAMVTVSKMGTLVFKLNSQAFRVAIVLETFSMDYSDFFE